MDRPEADNVEVEQKVAVEPDLDLNDGKYAKLDNADPNAEEEKSAQSRDVERFPCLFVCLFY